MIASQSVKRRPQTSASGRSPQGSEPLGLHLLEPGARSRSSCRELLTVVRGLEEWKDVPRRQRLVDAVLDPLVGE